MEFIQWGENSESLEPMSVSVMKEGNSVELYRESYMVHTRGMLGCTKCPVRHMMLSR